MLLPALSRAKTKAQGILCMNNGRATHARLAIQYARRSARSRRQQLWQAETDAEIAGKTYRTWVSNNMTWRLHRRITNVDLVRNGPSGTLIVGGNLGV